MKFSVRVEIDGLAGIADPEGQTIERALPALSFFGVSDVHVGRVVLFELEAADQSAAEILVAQMCERLLANPVIERTEVQITQSHKVRKDESELGATK